MNKWFKSVQEKGLKNICSDCDKRFLCHAICNNMDLIKQNIAHEPSDRAAFDSLRLALEENDFGYPLSLRKCDFALNDQFSPILRILEDQTCLYEKVTKTQT